MTDSERGRFIWHELMTPNPAGARDFYSTVLGWKVEPLESNASHSTFAGPTGPLGGCSERSPSAVPKWIPFVTVENVDETLREATGLGADVVVQPTAIESGGRYAVLTDPQRAAVGVYSAEDFGPERDPAAGEFSWHELATTDYRAAFDFYRALFGWENVSEHDMGPMGVYLIFGRGGKQVGGVFNKGEAGQAGEPAWLCYVRVADLSGALEKVEAARGTLLNGPMEVPGGDQIAQLLDPYGAAFALHTLAADVKAQGSAKAETQAPADNTVTEIWSTSAEGAEPPAAKKPSKKKSAKKASTKKAAKSKATKKKAKKAGGKAAKKKASGKQAAKKAGKKAGKRTAKKAAAKKKAGKKPATKKAGAKKAGKKAPKKSGKKTAKKAAKKAGKKRPAKKGSRGKKSSARSTGAKKSGKKKTGKKKAGKKARSKAGRR